MGYEARRATVNDIADVVRLRRVMFEAMGDDDTEALDRMCEASSAYLEEHMPTGRFRAWFAVDEGVAVAFIGLVLHSIPPAPDRLGTDEAYMMSLVTLPSHRRQGVASLHATAIGRGTYERTGFAVDDVTPRMRLMFSND